MNDIIKRIQKSYPTSTLEMTDKAIDNIISVGFSPAYGARPMRRYLEKTVVTAISRAIIAGDMGEGTKKKIIVDADDEKIVVRIE